MTVLRDSCALPAPPTDLLRGASLFLDFDGTLVTIAARPDAVRVERRVRTLLALLHEKLDGRLAIISGRAAGNITALLELPIVVAGSHGAELAWPDRAIATAASQPLDAAAKTQLQELAARHPGLLIEYKPLGVALHFRQAPEAQAACREAAARIAARTGLVVQPGKMVIELRTGGVDKGTALAALMEQAPLLAGRPIFIGDDDTDEAGFRMARDKGGAGILVGEDRPTAAAWRLADVPQTLAWLEDAAGTLS